MGKWGGAIMVINFLNKIFKDEMTMYVEKRERQFNDWYKHELDNIKKYELELQQIHNKLNNDLEYISYDYTLYKLINIVTRLESTINFLSAEYKSMVHKYWIYENQEETRQVISNIIKDINKIDNNFRNELFEAIEEILQNKLTSEDLELEMLILINRVLQDKRLDVRIHHKSMLKDYYEIHEKLDKQIKPITYTLDERISILCKIIENCMRKDYKEVVMSISSLIAPYSNSLSVPFSQMDKVLIITILILTKYSLEGKDILNNPRALVLLNNFLDNKQIHELKNGVS